jgi:hypothetical protein
VALTLWVTFPLFAVLVLVAVLIGVLGLVLVAVLVLVIHTVTSNNRLRYIRWVSLPGFSGFILIPKHQACRSTGDNRRSDSTGTSL